MGSLQVQLSKWTMKEREEGHDGLEKWEGYVDWRNRPAIKGRHGGMLPACFVLVSEILQSMAFFSIVVNFATYLMHFMHLPPATTANTMCNFVGVAFFLALVGGFLCDAYFSAYHVYLASVVIMILGYVMLGIQANSPKLMPASCPYLINSGDECEQVSGSKLAMLLVGLYLVAVGEGGIKGSLPAQGAEQFDEDTSKGRESRSTFFNYYVFCLSSGVLLAAIVVVWVEDNKGWQWGLALAAMALFLSIPIFLSGSGYYRNKVATGSPLTTIAKVIVASILNTKQPMVEELREDEYDEENEESREGPKPLTITDDLKCLNKAVERIPFNPSFTCTAGELSAVKAVLHLLPIFLATVPLNFSLSQVNAFTLQQAMTMDTTIGSFRLSPAIFIAFPSAFIMITTPLYDNVFVPLVRRLTGIETGIRHLQRMAIGLVLSIIATFLAALVEIKRKKVAWDAGMQDAVQGLPISFFWVTVQMLVLGSADMFTLAGSLELFFTEMPRSMRSIAMALSWAAMSLGNFLGSIVVSAVNDVTSRHGSDGPWLAGKNLNYFHLERYYWLMCIINAVNFALYIYWARKYKYRGVARKEG